MNKKFLTAVSAIALTACVAVDAQARDGFYLAVRGGMTDPNMNASEDSVTKSAAVDLDTVWFVSGAFGYKWRYFRTEFEYTYRDDYSDSEDLGSGLRANTDLEATSYMINGYIDFLPNYVVSPYITGGLGYTNLKLSHRATNVRALNWDENNFTWMLGAGLSLRLNKCLNLDAGYRYLDMGDIDKANMNAHEYYAGLRYTF